MADLKAASRSSFQSPSASYLLHHISTSRRAYSSARPTQNRQFCDFYILKIALIPGIKQHAHLGNRQWCILLLLHQFGNPLTMLQLRLGGVVEVRGELRERRELAVLCQRGSNTPESFFTILVCAAPPTARPKYRRSSPGEHPQLNMSASRKIWPSVIEITLVGTNAERRQPESQSRSAVREPV